MKKIVLSSLLFFSLILMGCSQAAKDFTMNIATYNIRMDTEAISIFLVRRRRLNISWPISSN